MQPTFEQFVASEMTNVYCREPGLSIYIRKNLPYPGLYDLANITARKTGEGAYSDFLLRYASDYPFRVENVVTERFADFHRRMGWAELPCDWGLPTFLSPLAVQRGLGVRRGTIFHEAA